MRTVLIQVLCPVPETNMEVAAGEYVQFTVLLQDRFGNVVDSLPQASQLIDPISSAGFANTNTSSCVVVDGSNSGTAQIRCLTHLAGSHFIPVSIGGTPVSGSPATVSVVAGATSQAMTRVFGDGLDGGTAGSALEIHIEAMDMFGNSVKEGGTVIDVRFFPESLDGEVVRVVDYWNGTITVVYSVRHLSEEIDGQIEVVIDGQPLEGSPWSPKWTAALPASASRSSVVLETASFPLTAGQLTKIAMMHISDEFGNTATGAQHVQLIHAVLEPQLRSPEEQAATNPLSEPRNVSLSLQEDGSSIAVYALVEVSLHV